MFGQTTMQWRVLGLILVAAMPTSVSALDIKLDARAESEYTTNSARTNSDEIEEWVFKPGLFLSAKHESAGVELDADYRFHRRIYQQDAFDDESIVTGTGRLFLNAVPGLLDFTVTNSRTETPIRSINSASPDNRQETANTQAGPTLKFRVRGKDEIQVQYLYGNRISERTDNNADSHTAILRYVLNSSASNRLNFEVIQQEVQFQNPIAPDIESTTGQVRWERSSDTLNWSLIAGYKETQRTLSRSDVDAPVINLEMQWQAAPNTSFFLEASRDVRDQSEVLGFGSTEFGQRLRADSDLNEIFTDTRFFGGLTQKIGHTNFTLGFLAYDEDYEDVLRDTELAGVILNANRRLNRLTTLDVRMRYFKQEYTDQDLESDILGGSALVTRRMSRRLSIAAGVYYDERDNDNPFFQASNYDEWLATIRVDYKLLQ